MRSIFVSCDDERRDPLQHNNFHDFEYHPKTVGVQRNPPLPKNRSKRWFSSATNVTTFSHAGSEILKASKLVVRQQISETREFAKCVVFQRGTLRQVFTTDVSVNEVQAFIRDLVRVLGWFTPLARYGR